MSQTRFIMLAALLPAAVMAAQPADPARPDTLVPAFVYQSVFTHYRAMEDDGQTPDQAWRAANEEVARIGGHAGYMREEAPAPQAPKAVSRPAPQPAEHQHKH